LQIVACAVAGDKRRMNPRQSRFVPSSRHPPAPVRAFNLSV